jgi:hypothetical protein
LAFSKLAFLFTAFCWNTVNYNENQIKATIFEIFKKENKIKTEKSHFCSEAAIQFYFQMIFHMTLLKLLNDLHKTPTELKVCYNVCARGHTPVLLFTIVGEYKMISFSTKGKR